MLLVITPTALNSNSAQQHIAAKRDVSLSGRPEYFRRRQRRHYTAAELEVPRLYVVGVITNNSSCTILLLSYRPYFLP